MTNRISIVLSILSGLLLAISFPQFNLWMSAWIALIPLLFAIKDKSLLQSFGLGWIAGFVMFIGQIFWIKIFHISIPFVLSAYFGLYFGLFCLLYRFIKDRMPISDLVIIPVIWTAIEFVRSTGSWGFPAGLLGYSQHNNLAFIQIVDIVGIFGLSYLLALINTSIFLMMKGSYAEKLIAPVAMIVIVSATYGYGAIKLNEAQIKPNFKVGLIQPGIDYGVEKNDYNVNNVLGVLEELTDKAAKHKPDLIVWPETVIKENIRLDPAISIKLNRLVNKYKAYLLFGNPDVAIVGEKVKHFNSAFLVSPLGEVVAQYNKVHPVPFWEIIPARHYLPFLKNTESKGTCDPGNEFTVFKTPKGNFSALICFEGIFPDLTRQLVRNGAQFLVNITNDSWSNSETEHYQHASMDIFRAIENRMFYLRVGNSGVTEVVDPYGRIVKSLPIYKQDYLIADIDLNKTRTFYNKYGDFLGYLSSLIAISLIGSSLFSKRRVQK